MADDFIMTIWTIYDHPLDYPNDFVVRGSNIMKGGKIVPHEQVTRHETLEQARRSLPAGLCKLTRFEEDDPVVVEVWL